MAGTAVRIALIAGLFGLLAYGILGGRSRHGGLTEGTPAPPFRLESLAGGTFDSSTLRGRVVVLNFWATWCPPCVEELPSLEGLHRALGGERLAVVSVSVDDDLPRLRRFVDRQRLTLTVLRDPGGRSAASAFGVQGFPTTFVIGADGLVRGRYVGPAEWDTRSALAHFRKLIAG